MSLQKLCYLLLEMCSLLTPNNIPFLWLQCTYLKEYIMYYVVQYNVDQYSLYNMDESYLKFSIS